MIRNPTSTHNRRDLMLALEKARMRLAVALAAGTKSIPRNRWLCYLDTTDQIRQLVKKLRDSDLESSPNSRSWISALDKLDSLPVSNQASRLCEILREIARKFDGIE